MLATCSHINTKDIWCQRSLCNEKDVRDTFSILFCGCCTSNQIRRAVAGKSQEYLFKIIKLKILLQTMTIILYVWISQHVWKIVSFILIKSCKLFLLKFLFSGLKNNSALKRLKHLNLSNIRQMSPPNTPGMSCGNPASICWWSVKRFSIFPPKSVIRLAVSTKWNTRNWYCTRKWSHQLLPPTAGRNWKKKFI